MANLAAKNLLDLANQFREQRQFEQAIEYFLMAGRQFNADDNPDMALLCVTLGQRTASESLADQGRSASSGDISAPAGVSNQTELKLDRMHPDSYAAMGHLLLSHNKLREAVSAYDVFFGLNSAWGQYVPPSQERRIALGVPPIVFVAQHRSGSEYIRDALIAILGTDLYYPTLGTHPRDYPIRNAFVSLAKGGAIARLHTDPSENLFNVLEETGIDRFVVHFRDPRQTMLSWIHHCVNHAADVRAHRYYFTPTVPADIAEWSFERRTEWSIENYFPGIVWWIEAWIGVEEQIGKRFKVSFTTYDQFHSDAEGFVRGMLDFYEAPSPDLPIASYLSDPAHHRNFRKGSTTEWRDAFTASQRSEIFSRMGPNIRARFGWEP